MSRIDELYEEKENLEIKYADLKDVCDSFDLILNNLSGIEEIDEDDYSELELIKSRIEDIMINIDNKIVEVSEKIEWQRKKKQYLDNEALMNESFERSRL